MAPAGVSRFLRTITESWRFGDVTIREPAYLPSLLVADDNGRSGIQDFAAAFLVGDLPALDSAQSGALIHWVESGRGLLMAGAALDSLSADVAERPEFGLVAKSFGRSDVSGAFRRIKAKSFFDLPATSALTVTAQVQGTIPARASGPITRSAGEQSIVFHASLTSTSGSVHRAVWSMRRGKGRILFSSFGENVRFWELNDYQASWAGAIAWLLGYVSH